MEHKSTIEEVLANREKHVYGGNIKGIKKEQILFVGEQIVNYIAALDIPEELKKADTKILREHKYVILDVPVSEINKKNTYATSEMLFRNSVFLNTTPKRDDIAIVLDEHGKILWGNFQVQRALATYEKTVPALVSVQHLQFPKKHEYGGELSGTSRLFVDMMKERKIARKTFYKDNPKYQEQMNGIKEAIDNGYLYVKENPIGNGEVWVRPTQKLQKTYYKQGGPMDPFQKSPFEIKFPLGEQQRLIELFLKDNSKKEEVIAELKQYRDSYLEKPNELLFGKPKSHYAEKYQEAIDFVSGYESGDEEKLADGGGIKSHCGVTRNVAKGGIEIKFPAKPSDTIIYQLKSNGWRYSRFQNLWWIRYSDSAFKLAQDMCDGEATMSMPSTAPVKMRMITNNTLTSKGRVPKNILMDEIRAGKLEAAIKKTFDPMSDSDSYIPDEKLVWKDPKEFEHMFNSIKNANTHWVNAIHLDKDGKISFSSYVLRYKPEFVEAEVPKSDVDTSNISAQEVVALGIYKGINSAYRMKYLIELIGAEDKANALKELMVSKGLLDKVGSGTALSNNGRKILEAMAEKYPELSNPTYSSSRKSFMDKYEGEKWAQIKGNFKKGASDVEFEALQSVLGPPQGLVEEKKEEPKSDLLKLKAKAQAQKISILKLKTKKPESVEMEKGEGVKVSSSLVSGTMAGSTFDLPRGEYILQRDCEVYHGSYQDVNKIDQKYHRGYKTINWIAGTKVIVNPGGVWLFNPKMSTEKFYGIRSKEQLQEIAAAINNEPSSNSSMATGGGVESLEKELHKLQRDFNSSRLSTYMEGDNSEEQMARNKEREVKLARFNEVLQLLREKK